MDLDRSLDDIIKDNRQARTSGGPTKKSQSRGNSARSTPYRIQRQHSAHGIPSAPRGDSPGAWKHDLYRSINNTAATTNGAHQTKEQQLQFPPKRLTEAEKSQALRGNPLWQRLDAPKFNQSLFPPPTPPTAPAAMRKSFSTPNLPTAPPPAPRTPQPPSISIAGTASANVILSNLAPTVSVEDIKATLKDIGGGVKEVHIVSTQGGSLQVKVSFRKPEGARECVEKYNGIKADGRVIKAAFEKSVPTAPKNQEISFLNRQGGTVGTARGGKRGGRRGGGGGDADPQYTGLYSDQMLGNKKR